MRLRSLFISNIRNLVPQNINLTSDVIYLEGKNGQGKTSVLEAIFLLSHIRSFRSQALSDLVTISKEKPESSFIRANVETALGEISLEFLISGKKRELTINDKKITKVDEFCGKLKTVLFTPEDLEIVKGAPLIRRQFLDRILVMLKPSDISLLNNYSKVLKFRNKLLKDKQLKQAILLNEKLILLDLEIVKKRVELVSNLRGKVKKLYFDIAGTDAEENFDLIYQSSFIKEDKILDQESVLKLFQENEQRDYILGRTTLGCHKDELRIDLLSRGNRMLSRVTSSQGQVRTKVLSFKLASAEIIKEVTDEWPILLLDDVESELDDERINNLRQRVFQYPGQVFITGTKIKTNDQSNINAQKFVVSNGVLTE